MVAMVIPRYRFSRHAQMRRKQMGLTEHRVLAVLEQPEIVYPSGPMHTTGRTPRTTYVRGDLVVAVNDENEIITVLWNGQEGRDLGTLGTEGLEQ